LIAAGLVPNDFILHLNRGPYNEDEIPAPSRLYRHPLEYFEPERDGQEGTYLLHPALSELPFVKRVEAAIGQTIPYRENDEFGRPMTYRAKWWHAVDLMTEEHCGHLLNTHISPTETVSTAMVMKSKAEGLGTEYR
jgi:hypothetical protein